MTAEEQAQHKEYIDKIKGQALRIGTIIGEKSMEVELLEDLMLHSEFPGTLVREVEDRLIIARYNYEYLCTTIKEVSDEGKTNE